MQNLSVVVPEWSIQWTSAIIDLLRSFCCFNNVIVGSTCFTLEPSYRNGDRRPLQLFRPVTV